jgi:hypothetical protein
VGPLAGYQAVHAEEQLGHGQVTDVVDAAGQERELLVSCFSQLILDLAQEE